MTFVEAVRKANFDEIVHRADRRDDYDGYRAKLGDLHISRQGIGGVQFAEVAVDTETGVVKVERVVAVHDCGRPINPKLIESQIYGGVIQGVSYALYEERHLDPATGVQLNANIDQYKIVGSRETPAIEVHVIEQLGRQSSTDARGVAEPANVATAAAIANAFYNATGKRIRTLPMTPANVLAALRADEGSSHEQLRVDRRHVGGGSRGAAGRAMPRGTTVAKAGGMDLLDLMKEGIVAPARVVNLQRIDALRGVQFDRHRGLAPRRAGDARARSRAIRRSGNTTRARGSGRPCGDAAGSQRRDDRRQPAAAAALLVLPQRALPCRARREVGREQSQYGAIFDNAQTTMVHASTPATALLAYGASVHLVGQGGQSRASRCSDFLLPPDFDRDRDTTLGNGEVLTHVTRPAARRQHARRVSQADRARQLRLADLRRRGRAATERIAKCEAATIVLGWVAPTPRRATASEALLVGREIDERVAAEAAARPFAARRRGEERLQGPGPGGRRATDDSRGRRADDCAQPRWPSSRAGRNSSALTNANSASTATPRMRNGRRQQPQQRQQEHEPAARAATPPRTAGTRRAPPARTASDAPVYDTGSRS